MAVAVVGGGGGGRRQAAGLLSVELFGAVGNGSHDDAPAVTRRNHNKTVQLLFSNGSLEDGL